MSLGAGVDGVFTADGPLARTLTAFEPRDGQRRMAAAVAGALDDGGVLLVEAGTGTGKTLAYLVPAILSGQRVVVSTGTKNLQEQIFTKDLPLLAHVLPVSFTATCMKGRSNYLCLQRYEVFKEAPALRTDVDRVHFALVEAWAEVTDTGDRAEIDEVPDDLSFWPQIAATSETCAGATCPRYAECYVTRMRQKAAEADVVIVNHHLLCADAAIRHHGFGEVIPDSPALVIDEAHQLEDVATQHFGVAVSSYRVEALVDDAERVLRQVELARETRDALQRATLSLHGAGRAFFTTVAEAAMQAGAAAGGGPVAPAPRAEAYRAIGAAAARMQAPRRAPGLFDEKVRVTGETLAPAGEAGLGLIDALGSLADAAGKGAAVPDEAAALGRRATALRDDLRVVMRADDPAFVFFVEMRGGGIFLRALPIEVSGIVRELVLDRARTTVLTSATLTIAGSFDYVKARLGVTASRDVVLPSEFDHATQAILYLPRRMPDPRQPDFTSRAADEVVAILERTEGRAFVLFTSYASLNAVKERVARALPYPLLTQGTAPRGVLLETFKRTPNAVLFATSSFWQGVDVVGEALSCVIIDKLPFASPGDPIVAARLEAITARGGDPFATLQVPLAILTLLQGLGRLLRHRDDRGVLAILDPRIQTMGYGRRFLASLPPAPITHTLDDITRFMLAGDRAPHARSRPAP
jgi:ATP-dependent DNA helicase DinG